MSPLPFPTDNLYKFVALAGAALVITSFVFPLTRLDEIELAVQQTSAQRKVLGVELSALEADLQRLGADVKQLGASADARTRPALALKNEVATASERLLEFDKKRLALAIKSAEMQGIGEKNALLLKQMDRTWSYLKFGSVIGLVMMQLGFFFWYWRVQKPADLEAHKKATA